MKSLRVVVNGWKLDTAIAPASFCAKRSLPVISYMALFLCFTMNQPSRRVIQGETGVKH
jgi:hypothetical protein